MTDQLSRIAALNDRVRQGLDPRARVVITAACVAALAERSSPDAMLHAQAELLMAIHRCDFAPDERRDDIRACRHHCGCHTRVLLLMPVSVAPAIANTLKKGV